MSECFLVAGLLVPPSGLNFAAATRVAMSLDTATFDRNMLLDAGIDLSDFGREPATCILTNAQGDDADDCTTHEHAASNSDATALRTAVADIVSRLQLAYETGDREADTVELRNPHEGKTTHVFLSGGMSSSDPPTCVFEDLSCLGHFPEVFDALYEPEPRYLCGSCLGGSTGEEAAPDPAVPTECDECGGEGTLHKVAVPEAGISIVLNDREVKLLLANELNEHVSWGSIARKIRDAQGVSG